MISALSWIPRGVAKSVPVEAAITEEEIAAAKLAAEGIHIGPCCLSVDNINEYWAQLQALPCLTYPSPFLHWNDKPGQFAR